MPLFNFSIDDNFSLCDISKVPHQNLFEDSLVKVCFFQFHEPHLYVYFNFLNIFLLPRLLGMTRLFEAKVDHVREKAGKEWSQ